MSILVLVLITLLTIFYLFLFCKQISKFAKKVVSKEDLNYSKNESKVYDNLGLLNVLSYIFYLIFLLATMFSAKYIYLKAWVLLYYGLWILGALFIYINIKLLNHFLDVLFVNRALKEIEKEFLIGAVVKRKDSYYFNYRLTSTILKIK